MEPLRAQLSPFSKSSIPLVPKASSDRNMSRSPLLSQSGNALEPNELLNSILLNDSPPNYTPIPELPVSPLNLNNTLEGTQPAGQAKAALPLQPNFAASYQHPALHSIPSRHESSNDLNMSRAPMLTPRSLEPNSLLDKMLQDGRPSPKYTLIPKLLAPIPKPVKVPQQMANSDPKALPSTPDLMAPYRDPTLHSTTQFPDTVCTLESPQGVPLAATSLPPQETTPSASSEGQNQQQFGKAEKPDTSGDIGIRVTGAATEIGTNLLLDSACALAGAVVGFRFTRSPAVALKLASMGSVTCGSGNSAITQYLKDAQIDLAEVAIDGVIGGRIGGLDQTRTVLRFGKLVFDELLERFSTNSLYTIGGQGVTELYRSTIKPTP